MLIAVSINAVDWQLGSPESSPFSTDSVSVESFDIACHSSGQ